MKPKRIKKYGHRKIKPFKTDSELYVFLIDTDNKIWGSKN